jgi:hypothetical protein
MNLYFIETDVHASFESLIFKDVNYVYVVCFIISPLPYLMSFAKFEVGITFDIRNDRRHDK